VKSLLLALVLLNAGCETCPALPGPGKRQPVTVQADVRVALDTCTEDRKTVSGNGEFATLACSDGGSGPVFRVLFPRKQWQSIKQDGVGLVNAGPGK
jgi:hypothetical protein